MAVNRAPRHPLPPRKTATTLMAMSAPPRPRLAIRIGVTGHRPDKLSRADLDVLRERISQVIEQVRQVALEAAADRSTGYLEEKPILRVVSALAEGSDRLVAEVALAAEFELHVILPYAADIYAQEFETADSRAEFRRLLAAANAVLVLDGTARDDEAYERVGFAVLQQSDVLIAVWDGEEAAGRGGTADIVRHAAEQGTLLAWVRADPPHQTSLLQTDGEELKASDIEELRPRLMSLVRPPAGRRPNSGGRAVPDLRERYFTETPVRGRLGHFYGILTRLVSRAGRPWPRFLPRDYVAATRAAWRRLWVGIPDTMTAPLEAALTTPYAWADQLATYYANRHRSAFTWIYLLTFLAVLFAFGKEHDEAHLLYWVLGYILTLVCLLGLWWTGKRRLWHERWLDYRSLAEQLRHLILLIPLGRGRPALRVPVHAAAFDPRATWVQWYVRGVASQTGLVSAVVDARYLDGYRALLRAELREQVEYHAALATSMQSVQRRLDRLVLALVLGGLAASALSFTHISSSALIPLTALLPALGGAIYGFLGEGEFRAIARRSQGIHAGLQGLVARLDKLRAPTSRSLERVAEAAVEMMGGELIDWRVDIGGKPLSLPKGH